MKTLLLVLCVISFGASSVLAQNQPLPTDTKQLAENYCKPNSVNASQKMVIQSGQTYKQTQNFALATPEQKLMTFNNHLIAIGNLERLVFNCELLKLLDKGI